MSSSIKALILVFSLAVSAVANAADQPKPTCGGVFDLCGYADANGAHVIPRRFEKARAFRHGLAAVRIDGLWGFIEPSGELAITPKFLAVGDFHGARAEAASNEGVGVIDRDGAFIIPPRFDRAIPFTNDVALVSERGDKPASKIARGVGVDIIHHSFRLYHRQHGWLTKHRHQFRWFRSQRDGGGFLIWASDSASRSPFGLMDDSGSWVVEPSFGEVHSLHEGLARVRRGLWGAVDERGEIAVPLQFDWLSDFKNGHALIVGPGPEGAKKHGLIRSDGSVVAEPEFDYAALSGEPGELPRVKRDGIWYRFDNGELIPLISTSSPEGSLVASCPQGLRVMLRAGGYFLTDADGNPALKEPVERVSFGIAKNEGSYSSLTLLSRDLDCRAPISASVGSLQERNLRGTYIQPNGRPLFDPPRFFTETYVFIQGHAVVSIGRRGEDRSWGIIDTEGHFTLALGPNRILPESQASELAGKAIFSVNSDEGAHLIDAHGNPAPDVEKALEDRRRQHALTCSEDATIIGNGDRFGIARTSGEVLVPAIHRAIRCYRYGVAWAPNEKIGKWCPIGPDGRFRDAPSCQEMFYHPVTNSHHVPEPFADDRFESGVLWVRALLRYGLRLRDAPPRWIRGGRF